MEANERRHGPLWLEIVSVLLTPFVLAGASYWVTFKINQQQQKNAQIIAKAQMKNAEKLTEAEINGAKLGQIRELFKEIHVEKPELPKKEIIVELAAYGLTALPFLIRAQQYAHEQNSPELKKASQDAIKIVLGSSQLELQGVNLSGQSLRTGKFINYNLSGANFSGSNPYISDFYKSNLIKADFRDTDLYLANLKRANLTRADFTGANLRRANFKGAKLDGATFKGARHAEDAKFTPSSLKDGIFTKETIAKLIEKYREEIDRNPYGENLLQILTDKYDLLPSELGE